MIFIKKSKYIYVVRVSILILSAVSYDKLGISSITSFKS